MPAVALVGQDAAGGVIVGQLQSKLRISGKFAAVLGDPVAGHGNSPHTGPTMAQASSKLTVQGIPVCLAGHQATCGHATSGSAKMTSSS